MFYGSTDADGCMRLPKVGKNRQDHRFPGEFERHFRCNIGWRPNRSSSNSPARSDMFAQPAGP